MMILSSEIRSVAVIGGGPAGNSDICLGKFPLACFRVLINATGAIAASALKAENYFERIRVFERRESPGGTWFAIKLSAVHGVIPC
jgi:hypothetical protein